MTKISIVREDATVTIDGRGYKVDVSDVPTYIHAIQWDGSRGVIEFSKDEKGHHAGNLNITDFSPFLFLQFRWNEQHSEWEAKEKKRLLDEAKDKELAELRKVAGSAVERKIQQNGG